ncbi:hypothetical protein [Flexivirga sp. B27]
MAGEHPAELDHGSEEFRTLAAAVRTYSRLVEESRLRPTQIDPVDLLHALSDVGEASVAMVRSAGAL